MAALTWITYFYGPSVGMALTLPYAQSVFCHVTQMPKDELGRSYLNKGEEVEFEIGNGKRGACAVNVQLVVPREPAEIEGYFEDGL